MSNLYYDICPLLTHNRIFNFVMGNRSAGKTFAFKEWAIRDFLKNGKEFVYVRRYKSELYERKLFFNDIVFKFPEHKFEVNGWKAYIDGKIAGHFIALTTSTIKKSTPYPNVNKIGFDEFIIDKGKLTYLPNEPELVMDLYNTVDRYRDEVRVIFMANAISSVNPHYMYWSLKPTEKRFTTFKKGAGLHCLIENIDNVEMKEKAKSTRAGQMSMHVEYGKMSIENQFFRDSDEFLEKKNPKSIYQGTLYYNKNYYGVWYWVNGGKVYISQQHNPETRIYAITTEDMKANSLLLKTQSKIPMFKFLKDSFSLGVIFYENQVIKNQFFEIMRLIYGG